MRQGKTPAEDRESTGTGQIDGGVSGENEGPDWVDGCRRCGCIHRQKRNRRGIWRGRKSRPASERKRELWLDVAAASVNRAEETPASRWTERSTGKKDAAENGADGSGWNAGTAMVILNLQLIMLLLIDCEIDLIKLQIYLCRNEGDDGWDGFV